MGWVVFGRGFGRYQCSVRAYVGGGGRLLVFGLVGGDGFFSGVYFGGPSFNSGESGMKGGVH